MSLFSDYEAEYAFERDFPHGINNDEWRTRDGTVLKLKDMTTQHITNCMRIIGKNDDFWYAMDAELKRRKAHETARVFVYL